MKVKATAYACFFPDLSVSCDPRDIQQKANLLTNPKLIIEVLSPSTEKGDRGNKFQAFQECPTVQEYVLVSQEREEIEVFRRYNTLWLYSRYKKGEGVELTSINVMLPVEVVYNNILLPQHINKLGE